MLVWTVAVINTLYIGGKWRSAIDGGTLAVLDPALGSEFSHVSSASPADVDLAVEAARQALNGSWSRTSGEERGRFLSAFADEIRARSDEIATLEVRDNGKPLPEARWDVADAIACFEYYSRLASGLDRRQGSETELADQRFACSLYYEPVGVAGLVIPWNYPFLMAAWKVAPALAAGCTIVLKSSEITPLTAIVLASISQTIGLPGGVLNVINGTGPVVSAAMAAHPGISKISFSGSVATGKRILAATAPSIKAASLELGGKSAMIVFADCNVDAVVEWIMFGIFWNQGQVCSATSRVFIENGIYKQVRERLIERSRKIVIGNGMTPGVQLGPVVSSEQMSKVKGFIAGAVAMGARITSGGRRPSGVDRGYFIEPTILEDAGDDNVAWREEIFGPVVCLRAFSTEDEAIEGTNNSRFGLAAAVMSEDPERCNRVAGKLKVGVVWLNCSQPKFVEAPWGGVKESGIGRELGTQGFDNFLSVKQVTRYRETTKWGWYEK
jgi:betaine-aldehyde dehydrogenase